MASSPPPYPGKDLLAHPPFSSASILEQPPPNPEHLLHDGVGSVADGVGKVGGQDGNPQIGMDGGGDPQMGVDGGDGRRHQCKNLVTSVRNQRQKLDVSSVVPNSTKNGTNGVGRVGGQEIDGGEPQMHMDNGGDPHMRTVAAGRKRKNTDRNQPNDTFVSREKYQKVKSASPRLRSPFQVTSSPGVNLMVRSSLKREGVKRENMAGSPKTPQPASCSLEGLSPDTIAANLHASKRKRRKLISDIWREAEPIYKEGKLVEGKCIHCHQIFVVKIIIQEGLSAVSPCPDVSSRWNSTFLMLEAALPLRNAFISLESQDKEYTFAPLNSEWELAEAVLKVLEVFYTATNILSGSKYPTSHLYFYQLWNIKKLLNKEASILKRKLEKEEASTQDITIANMVEQMQTKFNQYWKETYMSACIPVILDPRYKYDLLEYLLNEFGSEKEAETWMAEVKQNMQELFNDYNKEVSGASQRDSSSQEVQDDNDPLAEWDRYMKSKRHQSSNELDQYLTEQLTPRKEEVDILHWWKTKSEIYPVLSNIARDVLAIPASTVPSESAFSTGGRVISDYRSSLTPTTVEALICLQDWFKAADARKNE